MRPIALRDKCGPRVLSDKLSDNSQRSSESTQKVTYFYIYIYLAVCVLQLLHLPHTPTFISSFHNFSRNGLKMISHVLNALPRFPCFWYDCLEFWGAGVPTNPIATRLRGGWPRNRGSIPGRSNIYPIFWNIQTASGARQAIRLFDAGDSFPGSKADWTWIWPMTPSNAGG
jgi:hypothetical protein